MMRRDIRAWKRATGSVFVGVATAVVALVGPGACITAPPPDLPEVPLQGPQIIQNAVRPPTNAYLTALPADGGFIVPVRVSSAAPTIAYAVYVDFDPSANVGGSGLVVNNLITTVLDGGIAFLSFQLRPSDIPVGMDPNACHVIQLFVASSFDSARHVPTNSLGSDSVTWFYAPGGPGTCDQFDAGDGAPPPDAPLDGLPITPDSVGPI
jgi:hypothetical protein